MNELLKYYLMAVESPGVSGFEHLQMLDVRDNLQQIRSELTAEELDLLAGADYRLLTQAAAFHAELAQVTNLARERTQQNQPPAHWWWYLDVLAQLPAVATDGKRSDASEPQVSPVVRQQTSPAYA